MSIELRPIGFVCTDARELPRHWSVSDVEGTLVIGEEYSEGLRGIRAGQRIVVIFHFHRSPGFSPELLRQTSGQTGRETGVFDTCSPVRPIPMYTAGLVSTSEGLGEKFGISMVVDMCSQPPARMVLA